MKITADLFHAYLKCPTKCFLIAIGEVPSENTYADWVLAQGEHYRKERIIQLREEHKSDECVLSQPSTNSLKNAKWRFAVNFVVRAKEIETTIQAMERIPSKGKAQPTQFIPIRFVFLTKSISMTRFCWRLMRSPYSKSLAERLG